LKTLENAALFTHAGCMDGSAAAILFMEAGGKEEMIFYVPAGRVDDFLGQAADPRLNNKFLVIVDVAPHSEEVAQWLEMRGNFVCIDHHYSAKWLHGRDHFHIDVENNACGCENFRRWLVKENFQPKLERELDTGMKGFDRFAWREFCAIVDDNDRWIRNRKMSGELPLLFSPIGQREFVRRMSNVEDRFGMPKDNYWTGTEKELISILSIGERRRFFALMKKFQVRKIQFEGREISVAYIVSDEVNCSQLLHDYMDLHPEVDVTAQVNLNLGKVSLRSNGKVDVSKFGEKFDGGGHKNSGGHPLPKGLIDDIITRVHG
jgi:oligoribonuclease NrnB/cAMP/cGMP phosphodiesterase (DHH superfamily)